MPQFSVSSLRTSTVKSLCLLLSGWVIATLLASQVWAQAQFIEKSRTAAREYRFPMAIAAMEQCHRLFPNDSLVWREYALRLQEAHQYTQADSVWTEYLIAYPTDIEGFRNDFQSKLSTDSTKKVARPEIQKIVKSVLPSLKRERQLALCYVAGEALEDSLNKRGYLDSLTGEFPLNKIGFLALGEQFYDDMAPIWTSAKEKISYCRKFIDKYSKSYWRAEAYQFLLAAYAELGQKDSLFIACAKWNKEMPESPLPLLLAGTWAMRLDTLYSDALVWSKKAVDLSASYQFPDLLDPMQQQYQSRRLWIESREDYLWALWKNHQSAEAFKVLPIFIERSILDKEDDFTFAGLYTVAGWIFQSESKTDSAKLYFAKALELGDRKNFWSVKADSSLQAMGVIDRLVMARKLLKYDGPVFTDVTDSVGLNNRHESRVAWGDFNNDGYDDLLLNGGVLFQNIKGKFTNVSESVNLPGSLNGGVWGDFNNDGFLDIYAIGNGDCGDKLFAQHSDGFFDDITDSAGVCDSVSSEGAGWDDMDNDGYLDLYVANYEKPGTLGSGTSDILYRNQGNRTFARVTEERGLTPPWNKPLCGRGVNWCDFNRDGFADLFVSNYRLQENLLFVNDPHLSLNLKPGWFENRAPQYHVNGDERDGWFGHTIGSEWGDLDNDGDFDLVSVNLAHPRYIEFSNKTQILINPGNNQPFADQRSETGIKYEETHSDPALGDVNGDGYLDIYLTSIYENRRSFLYLSIPDERSTTRHYRDITYLSGVRTMNGWGCAYSDYDNDGDLDLVVGSGSGLKLFRNDSPLKPFLKISVQDEIGNRQGIGIQIEAKQGNRVWVKEIQGGKGTTGQHSLVQLFTGFNPEQPLDLTIYPPGRAAVHQTVTKFNQKLTITLAAPQEEEISCR